ncbi:hypothetical protein DVH05_012665 [Phytophthora capsici]|nr:hypothetical protein DVH05_012665 [Phytophthora capsici]
MACGKLYVQSCNLLWFLSTVYLVHITQGNFNLVIKRPRVAGGTLTIPLDLTVRISNPISKDREQNIIRLQYGPKATQLVMRAASYQDRKQWLVAIAAAMPASLQSKNEELQRRSYNAPEIAIKSPAKRSQPREKPTRYSHEAFTPAHNSFHRVVRHNIPSAMQFVITIGQIIASVH